MEMIGPPVERDSVAPTRECGGQTIEESIIELSIVMPCLNEADTVGECIRKAQQGVREHDICAEVIVSDNGSTDDSVSIATGMGARVVRVQRKGYGNALMGGIAVARGKFIIMGDSDDSYDFREIFRFVMKLREGFELVQGCRLPAGGGSVRKGAMPFLHRWVGNPLLSRMAKRMFSVSVHDVYCGMRGFTKDLYNRLEQQCTGMEFATEMIVKASLQKVRIAEVPITLHADGRRSHPPHLRTFRDGWRTVRLFMMYSPRWLFLVPGAFLVLLGLVGYGLAMPGITLMGATFDAHTLLFGSLFILMGYQSIVFAIFAKAFAIGEGLLPPDKFMSRFLETVNLEKGLIVGGVALLIGGALLLEAVRAWWVVRFGHLDYAHTMRLVVPGATLTALGFQTVLSSFLIGLLAMHRK